MYSTSRTAYSLRLHQKKLHRDTNIANTRNEPLLCGSVIFIAYEATENKDITSALAEQSVS